MERLAVRYDARTGRPWYVSHIPAPKGSKALRDGVDWGYVNRIEEAKPLSLYWQRRFTRDCEACGVKKFNFIPLA